MLSWLDSFWKAIGGTVADATRTAVHWAERALAGAVNNVFSVVGGAWKSLVGSVTTSFQMLGHFFDAVHRFAVYVLRVVIPNLAKWAESALAALSSDLASLGRYVDTRVQQLISRIAASYDALSKWVMQDVWDPLWAKAQQLAADLIKWGYTAWWFITHPAALADLLILDLAVSAEKQAWTLARMLGRFTLSLIIANLQQVANLIEDIITAVL